MNYWFKPKTNLPVRPTNTLYWFRPKRFWGWFAFYVPTSFGGWIVTLVLLAMGIAFFILIDRQSHPASDTLMNFAPWAIILMLIFDMLCFRLGEYPLWWSRRESDEGTEGSSPNM